jgi:hypothetical protein
MSFEAAFCFLAGLIAGSLLVRIILGVIGR